MAYEKQEWTYEDWLQGRYNVQEKLNHMEDGIADAGRNDEQPAGGTDAGLPTNGNNKDVLVLTKTGKGVPLVGISDKLYLNISSEAIDKLYELYKNGSFDDTVSPAPWADILWADVWDENTIFYDISYARNLILNLKIQTCPEVQAMLLAAAEYNGETVLRICLVTSELFSDTDEERYIALLSDTYTPNYISEQNMTAGAWASSWNGPVKIQNDGTNIAEIAEVFGWADDENISRNDIFMTTTVEEALTYGLSFRGWPATWDTSTWHINELARYTFLLSAVPAFDEVPEDATLEPIWKNASDLFMPSTVTIYWQDSMFYSRTAQPRQAFLKTIFALWSAADYNYADITGVFNLPVIQLFDISSTSHCSIKYLTEIGDKNYYEGKWYIELCFSNFSGGEKRIWVAKDGTMIDAPTE